MFRPFCKVAVVVLFSGSVSFGVQGQTTTGGETTTTTPDPAFHDPLFELWENSANIYIKYSWGSQTFSTMAMSQFRMRMSTISNSDPYTISCGWGRDYKDYRNFIATLPPAVNGLLEYLNQDGSVPKTPKLRCGANDGILNFGPQYSADDYDSYAAYKTAYKTACLEGASVVNKINASTIDGYLQDKGYEFNGENSVSECTDTSWQWRKANERFQRKVLCFVFLFAEEYYDNYVAEARKEVTYPALDTNPMKLLYANKLSTWAPTEWNDRAYKINNDVDVDEFIEMELLYRLQAVETSINDTVTSDDVAKSVQDSRKEIDVELDKKAVTTYVDSKLDKKAEKSYVDTELGKKAATAYVNTELDKKADTSYVDTELGKKAATAYVNTELGKKADTSYVDTELGKKAVADDVTTELGKKADKTYVDTELGKKAVADDVTTELGKKAATSYVDTELGKKAVADDVTTELGKKADKTYVDTELGKKAATAYVNTELDKKAATSYVDTELGKKVATAYVNTELDKKAATSYVDTEVDKKASTPYVDTALSKKVDKTYLDAELNKKADNAEVSKTVGAAVNNTNAKLSAVETLLDTKASSEHMQAMFAVKANASYVDAQLAAKADISFVVAELDKKVRVTSDVAAVLETKADAGAVQDSLALKANASFVAAELKVVKTAQSSVEATLSTKADKSILDEVLAALALANTKIAELQSDVAALTADKASKTFVGEELAKLDNSKASKVHVDQEVARLDEVKADVAYVDEALAERRARANELKSKVDGAAGGQTGPGSKANTNHAADAGGENSGPCDAGQADPTDCNLFPESACGTIKFGGTMNVTAVCPVLCNNCSSRDASADDEIAEDKDSSAGFAVAVVITLLLVAAAAATFVWRKKRDEPVDHATNDGPQSSSTQSRSQRQSHAKGRTLTSATNPMFLSDDGNENNNGMPSLTNIIAADEHADEESGGYLAVDAFQAQVNDEAKESAGSGQSHADESAYDMIPDVSTTTNDLLAGFQSAASPQGFQLDAAMGAGDAYDMPDGFELTFVDGNATAQPSDNTRNSADNGYEMPISVLQALAATNANTSIAAPTSVVEEPPSKFKRKPSVYNGFDNADSNDAPGVPISGAASTAKKSPSKFKRKPSIYNGFEGAHDTTPDASNAAGQGNDNGYDLPDGFQDGEHGFQLDAGMADGAGDAYDMPDRFDAIAAAGASASLHPQINASMNGGYEMPSAVLQTAAASKPTPTSGNESSDDDGYTPHADHDNADADGAYDEVKPYDEIDSAAPYDEVVNPYAEVVDKPYDEIDNGAYDEVDNGAYDEVGQNETEL